MRKRLPAHLLKALHAEWRKMSPNVEFRVEGRELKPGEEERLARLAWTNSALVTRHSSLVTSWSQLTQGQAKYLLKKMREESGDGPAYRATLIARLAVELWGVGGQGPGVGDWDAILRERLVQRFRVSRPEDLAPGEAHAMMEELQRRIAERDGVDIEEVRARFARKKEA
jgi:hypothetical protein